MPAAWRPFISCIVCSDPLLPGDDLIGRGDREGPDGALHGLWIHLRCAGRPILPDVADDYWVASHHPDLDADTEARKAHGAFLENKRPNELRTRIERAWKRTSDRLGEPVVEDEERPSGGTPAVTAGLPAGPGSGVSSPAQALELAPETLAGPALPTHDHDVRPSLRHDRRAVVHVAGRGDGGPDTGLDRPHDLDDALAVGDEGLHPIACADLRRRLRRRSIHEDVAAVAQSRPKRAGLHETHRAQPAVDARLVGSGGTSHAI
jgi:hypothetical protein